MTFTRDLMKQMMEKFGGVIDLTERPEALDEIVEACAARMKGEGFKGGGGVGVAAAPPPAASASPFGVSWMDSWVAHWVYAENVARTAVRDRELATVLQNLADLKFRERLAEIRRVIGGGPRNEPPDGGPPEPGVPPPAGPSSFDPRFSDGPSPSPEPPDGGPPEPGVPPAGPADFGAFRENPWILYWFVSLKVPMLLDVIDLHITRRLDALRSK